MSKPGRHELSREQLITRAPYSEILQILASKKSLGERVTWTDLSKMNISLPPSKRNGVGKTVTGDYLSRLLKTLEKKGLVNRYGGKYSLTDYPSVALATQVNGIIINSGHMAVHEDNIHVVFPGVWGQTLSIKMMQDAKILAEKFEDEWTSAVLAEIEQRFQHEIINAKDLTVPEKANCLIRLHEVLPYGPLEQLGWFVEGKLNTKFLEEKGILSFIQALYEKDGTGLIHNRLIKNSIKKRVDNFRKIEERKRNGNGVEIVIGEIGKDMSMEIAQRVARVLRPLESFCEPLILAKITLPSARSPVKDKVMLNSFVKPDSLP